jgi:hypothetical protein
VIDDGIGDLLAHDIRPEAANRAIHHLKGQQLEAEAESVGISDPSRVRGLLRDARDHYAVIDFDRSRDRVERKIEHVERRHGGRTTPVEDDGVDASGSVADPKADGSLLPHDGGLVGGADVVTGPDASHDADVPHQGWLWRYIDDAAEWDRRLERRYDDFVTAAVDAGVDRRTVEANFDPESAVWTPVQFRETFGTVEWRSPDAALPTQVVRLADDIASVVDGLRDAEVRIEGDRGHVSDDEIVLPSFDTVLGHVDDAIDPGLDSAPLRSYLDRMGLDVDAYRPLSPDLDVGDSLTHAEARQCRLDAADRLERDVLRAEPVSSD